MAPRKRLSREDWVAAALRALAGGGIAAVAVEPLAARLGTTKGSFYWHFADRAALLAATLEHWERIATEDVITALGTRDDVGHRLRALLRIALDDGTPVELALQPHAKYPDVAPALERVTRRRLEYLDGLFGELGFDAAESRQRSLFAYTAYLGHLQLVHATPGLAPAEGDVAAYVDRVIAVLTAAR